MTRLLFITASPRGSDSSSIAVANAYLDALKSSVTDLEIDTLDPWTETLPEYDGNRVAAKLTVFGGGVNEGLQATQWDEIVSVADRFIAADHYLFAIPMWNNGIPYKLKHYIDLVHQPGLTFNFDPSKGYIGLLGGKRATLVYTSAGFASSMPSPAFGVDHQSTYMRSWLEQAGITNIEEIRFQPSLLTADPEADFDRAKAHAAALGSAVAPAT